MVSTASAPVSGGRLLELGMPAQQQPSSSFSDVICIVPQAGLMELDVRIGGRRLAAAPVRVAAAGLSVPASRLLGPDAAACAAGSTCWLVIAARCDARPLGCLPPGMWCHGPVGRCCSSWVGAARQIRCTGARVSAAALQLSGPCACMPGSMESLQIRREAGPVQIQQQRHDAASSAAGTPWLTLSPSHCSPHRAACRDRWGNARGSRELLWPSAPGGSASLQAFDASTGQYTVGVQPCPADCTLHLHLWPASHAARSTHWLDSPARWRGGHRA